VLPDLYSNAGGVVVSFAEWVQNLQNFRWEAEEIDRQLDRYMVDAWRAIRRTQKERGGSSVSLRTAAYVLAVGRVAEAERHRGFD
jgi:glutamate dehydrogenase (NAD(P)+)